MTVKVYPDQTEQPALKDLRLGAFTPGLGVTTYPGSTASASGPSLFAGPSQILVLPGPTYLTSPIAESDVTNLVTDLAAKAPLASPALTGSPTAPTQAATDNSTKIATDQFVTGQSFVAGNLGAFGVQTFPVRLAVLTSDVSGTLPIANGGTANVTALAAFDALAPTTTRGDVTTRGATTSQRLALGANGLFLGSNGIDAVYRQPPYVAGYDAGGSVFNATTTLTSLLSATFTLPIFALGDYFELEGSFGWTNNTGAGQTLNIQVVLGGATVPVTVTTASIVANASNHRVTYSVKGRCKTVGAAGAGSISFNGHIFISAVTAVLFDNLQATTADFGGGGPTTTVTNATQSLDILAAMSTATAGGQVVPQPSSFIVYPKLV